MHRGEENDLGIGEDWFFYKLLSARESSADGPGRVIGRITSRRRGERAASR
jgi:hypothetical protein